jgi:predicted phosphodiesterase
MIYLLGDTHGHIDIGKLYRLSEKTTKDDYIIVLGDFGLFWSDCYIEIFHRISIGNMDASVLFILGNHENYDMINKCKTEHWNGGMVKKMSKNITCLMNGSIFNIEGKSFFVFGGAESIDKEKRIEGISWWKDEVPSFTQMNIGIKNLDTVGGKVDYVLSHTCPYKVLKKQFENPNTSIHKTVERYLEHLDDKILVDYKMWYFGHLHLDKEYGKYRCLFNDVVKI